MSLNRLLRSDGILNCVVGVIDVPFLLLVYLYISFKIYRCITANIALRHQSGVITASVVSGQLFNERTYKEIEDLLKKQLPISAILDNII